MDLHEQVRQGERIRNFLEDDVVKAVFQGLEMSYYQAWKEAITPSAREELHATVRAFDDVRSAFRAVVSSGERATLELEAEKHDTDPA